MSKYKTFNGEFLKKHKEWTLKLKRKLEKDKEDDDFHIAMVKELERSYPKFYAYIMREIIMRRDENLSVLRKISGITTNEYKEKDFRFFSSKEFNEGMENEYHKNKLIKKLKDEDWKINEDKNMSKLEYVLNNIDEYACEGGEEMLKEFFEGEIA